MKLNTKRFGEIEVDENNILTFPNGILGFPDIRKYILIREEGNDVFLWLQGIEEDIAFIITNPLFFKPDYKIKIPQEEVKELEVRDVNDIQIYAIVTVPSDPKFTSINLQGPILINPHKNLGKQIVLADESYPVKYFIFSSNERLAQSAG